MTAFFNNGIVGHRLPLYLLAAASVIACNKGSLSSPQRGSSDHLAQSQTAGSKHTPSLLPKGQTSSPLAFSKVGEGTTVRLKTALNSSANNLNLALTNPPAGTFQQPTACLQGHTLRHIPMLVGLPNTEMMNTFKRGEALLAGCVGNSNQPETAHVCETCQQWKTTDMAYWQPLPKEFGSIRK